MTSRQVYEALLVEMNKTDAPNIQLEDFNYFVNKAIYQYVNKRYNIYDINQQTTDDLRVLKATTRLIPKPVSNDIYEGLTTTGKLAIYECILPSDYLHMLNCICIYKVNRTYKCYNKNDIWRTAAKRLTADAYSQVLDNYWNRPTYKKPYYYIHNVNTVNTDNLIPTNPTTDTDVTINKNTVVKASSFVTLDEKGYATMTSLCKDGNKQYIFLIGNKNKIGDNKDRCVAEWDGTFWSHPDFPTISFVTERNLKFSNYNSVKNIIYEVDGQQYKIQQHQTDNSKYIWVPNSDTGDTGDTDFWGKSIANIAASDNFTGIKIGDNNYISNVERGGEIRYGNASQVRMEIRYGTDTSIFELIGVLVDYIKAPQNIRLTQEQLDWTEDRSQVLEFPDYVCQEIINELVHIIMENIGDPKLQTHPIVSQSIANPAQQQTEPVAQAT